tara:strand:- start:134 stop:1357 length:1224 start_codon:yes stop_codon:yes gene_type:complete
MAINWRRAMTQDRAYTAPPQYQRVGERSGPANVGGEPSWRGRRQPGLEVANTRAPKGTGLAQAVRGAVGNVRDSFFPGIAGLGQRMLGGINQNREDHRYLDSVLDRDEKNRALWNQAIRNYDTPVDPRSERPSALQFGETDTGTSLGQAGKYFTKAGLTDNDLMKFLGKTPSKWAGNEAWLSSQARDQDAFKTGMSFIKNAKATANLRRNLEAERDLATDFSDPDEIFADPVISAIDYDEMGLAPDPENDILYGEPDGVLEDVDSPLGDIGSYLDAGNLMPGSPVDTENLKRRAVFGTRKTGVRGMGPEEKFVRGFEYGDEFGYPDFGQAGMDDFAGMAPGDTRNVMNRAGRVTPGKFDQFYMNRQGDIINQGPITSSGFIPNISVEFGGDEEEIVGGPGGRYGLYD